MGRGAREGGSREHVAEAGTCQTEADLTFGPPFLPSQTRPFSLFNNYIVMYRFYDSIGDDDDELSSSCDLGDNDDDMSVSWSSSVSLDINGIDPFAAQGSGMMTSVAYFANWLALAFPFFDLVWLFSLSSTSAFSFRVHENRPPSFCSPFSQNISYLAGSKYEALDASGEHSHSVDINAVEVDLPVTAACPDSHDLSAGSAW